MKTINKASIVLALFFLLVYGLSIFSTSLVKKSADNSKSILQDNYASVKYSVNMLKALIRIHTLFTDQLVTGSNDTVNQSYVRAEFLKAKTTFDDNLALQENNITETSEEILTKDLRSNYEKYIAMFTRLERNGKPYTISDFAVLKPEYEKVQNYILDIYTLNIRAIVARNDLAIQEADSILKYVNPLGIISLSLTGIFILIYLAYLINIKRSKRMKV